MKRKKRERDSLNRKDWKRTRRNQGGLRPHSRPLVHNCDRDCTPGVGFILREFITILYCDIFGVLVRPSCYLVEVALNSVPRYHWTSSCCSIFKTGLELCRAFVHVPFMWHLMPALPLDDAQLHSPSGNVAKQDVLKSLLQSTVASTKVCPSLHAIGTLFFRFI